MDIQKILTDHAKWLANPTTGRRANLDDAILVRANLDCANLAGAILVRANLDHANLDGANLDHANLDYANLAHANLAHANLAYANLYHANLDHANLEGANLDRVSFTGASLNGATLPDGVPVIGDIDAAILAAIGEDASGLEMKDWHCGTTHCRAGWPVKLAGEAGAKLERRFGTGAAGALIYAASRPGMPVPNFFATNADALADLRKCAEMAEGQTP